MQTIEDLSDLLQQLGSDVEQVSAIIEDEPGSWRIHFDDGYAIAMHFSEERKVIELVAVLGKPDPAHELDVLRTMLCYQLLWREKNEPRIALDAQRGSLICLCEFELAVTRSPEFAKHLLNFWMQSSMLAEMVEAGIPHEFSPTSTENLHLHA